jgi:cell division protein FtsB
MFTLGMQVAILIVVALNAVNMIRTWKANAKMLELIMAYRREIAWLTARIEMIEQQREGPIA